MRKNLWRALGLQTKFCKQCRTDNVRGRSEMLLGSAVFSNHIASYVTAFIRIGCARELGQHSRISDSHEHINTTHAQTTRPIEIPTPVCLDIQLPSRPSKWQSLENFKFLARILPFFICSVFSVCALSNSFIATSGLEQQKTVGIFTKCCWILHFNTHC